MNDISTNPLFNLTFEPENALYLVPVPIGNISDITIRALRVLANAEIVACEDTRTSALLFSKLGIRAKTLTSYHEFNEREKAPYLAGLVGEGYSVAVVSDAGSPGLSDPGYRAVTECVKLGYKVIPLPGANALIPALSASGLPTNEFVFMGFPPQKKGRKTFLARLAEQDCTVVAYESTHRIAKFVDELVENCGPERKIVIAREISKIYEEFIRGTAAEVRAIIAERKELKGELVVIIAKNDAPDLGDDE